MCRRSAHVCREAPQTCRRSAHVCRRLLHDFWPLRDAWRAVLGVGNRSYRSHMTYKTYVKEDCLPAM
jgi:hypothetical protein